MRPEGSAEFELVREFSHAELPDANLTAINSLIDSGLNWDRFINLANLHRVLPLVANGISGPIQSVLPTKHLEFLDEQTRVLAVRSAFLLKECDKIVQTFEQHALRILPFKGPVLASLSYGDVRFRSFVDLDLLVDKDDFSAARDILRERGYTTEIALSVLNRVQERVYLWQDQQYPFSRGKGVFKVDLHRSLMPPLYSLRTNFNDLWNRSHSVTIDGYTFRSLHPEDRLLTLCFHGIKNRWSYLRLVCDVSETIRANPQLDWDLVLQNAIANGGKRILLLGLCLANELLDTELPPTIEDQLERSNSLSKVTHSIMARLVHAPTLSELGTFERAVLQLSSQDTIRQKGRYISMAGLRRLGDLILAL